MSGESERLIGAVSQERADNALRPLALAEFIGQGNGRRNLETFIHAARDRGDAMDHCLLHGPPGLGKTTLAQIVAAELGVGFRATSGPVIARAGDLAALLTNLRPRDVLFIDEIHRLAPVVEEVLYPAMEDFQLDLIIGEGPSARSVRIDLPPFTLVGNHKVGLANHPFAGPVWYPDADAFMTPMNWPKFWPGKRLSLSLIWPMMALKRSHAGLAEHRGSPAGCYGGCAILRRLMQLVPSLQLSPMRRCYVLRLTQTGLIRWIAGICRALRPRMAAGRLGSKR